MTTDPSAPKRPARGQGVRADGASTRSTERARDMRERAEVSMTEMRGRAEASMSYENGVVLPVDGEPMPEESSYERLFTGGDTVIPKPQPLHIDTPKVILLGGVAWAVMLVVMLLVPTLHRGSREWWPWMCVAGVVLGVLGWSYVRRGRGNAETA